jgi:hypothetical protein
VIRRCSRLHLAPLLLTPLLAGCPSESVTGAGLADGCGADADCQGGLVCSFGRCHQPCESSSGCPEDALCVSSKSGQSVCQLPDNERCTLDSDCLAPLLCASDGTCRNGCQQDSDCLEGQACAKEGVCAEAHELGTEGVLVGSSTSDGDDTGGGSGSAGASTDGSNTATAERARVAATRPLREALDRRAREAPSRTAGVALLRWEERRASGARAGPAEA